MPIFSIWKSFANRSCRKNYGPSRYETLKAQTNLKGVNYVTYFKDYVTFSEVNRINIVSQFFIQNLKYKKMNTSELKGNWNEQKGKLKQKFANLTDNDLMFEEGKKEEMLGKLQIKLGKTKEELHKIISSL